LENKRIKGKVERKKIEEGRRKVRKITTVRFRTFSFFNLLLKDQIIAELKSKIAHDSTEKEKIVSVSFFAFSVLTLY
jgi:hypothetical protein